MSLFALASGALIADPQRREGAKGPFAIATLRVATGGEESALVSIIAFSAEAERLFEYVKGDALAISGRAKLTAWTGRDGAERHGLSIVAEQIASARPRPRPAAPPRQRRPARARDTATGDPRPFDDEIGDLYARGEP